MTAARRRPTGIYLDTQGLRLFVNGEDTGASLLQLRLTAAFLLNPGRAFSRSELLDRCWPRNVFVNERTIDSHVAALRKLFVPYEQTITSLYGFGYRFDPPGGGRLVYFGSADSRR